VDKDRRVRTRRIKKKNIPEERRKIEQRYYKALNKEDKRHKKAISREQSKYYKNLDKMEKLYTKYKNDLKNGKTPISLEYIVADWKQPDEDCINESSDEGLGIGGVSINTVSKWQLVSNWRGLKKNMTEQQVYAILGKPETIETRKGKFSGTYGNVPGYGVISFEACSDLKARLRSWVEPFWPQVEKELCASSNKSNSINLAND
jgi:hypothetical protein